MSKTIYKIEFEYDDNCGNCYQPLSKYICYEIINNCSDYEEVVDENGELKIIGVTVSVDKLNDFVKGHIDLLTMFTSPELEDSIFHIHMKEEGIYAEHYNGVIDSSMLPDEGYFCGTD